MIVILFLILFFIHSVFALPNFETILRAVVKWFSPFLVAVYSEKLSF